MSNIIQDRKKVGSHDMYCFPAHPKSYKETEIYVYKWHVILSLHEEVK